MGDGVLVYFGYPQAEEDDAERAVRAGLRIGDVVSRLETMAGPAGTLRTRVGIATGVVVVGDLIGSGASLEASVVGDAPNLAARLQGLARPGTVLLSEEARRLVAGPFRFRSIGSLAIRGRTVPVEAWEVDEGPPIEREDSWRAAKTPLPVEEMAGIRPAIIAAKTARAIEKARTAPSTWIESARGSSRQWLASHRVESRESRRPSDPPATQISRLSVICSRMRVMRLPPRAPRTATSLRRDAPRATRRLETLRQAISNMHPTAHNSTINGVFTSSTTSSIKGR